MCAPRSVRSVLLALMAVQLAACSHPATRHSTSVVQFLYPKPEEMTRIATALPVLRLPLRVGIAFVPPAAQTPQAWLYTGERALAENDRVQLMTRVTDHFKGQPYIQSVEVIPSSYLTPGGGFPNLDQVRAMFAVDVMVLLAYDQVQYTEENAIGGFLSYWTIVGAYVVPAEKNMTTTLIDAAVLDVASRRLLFRAPGRSIIRGRSTVQKLGEELRQDRVRGFQQAAQDLIVSLEQQLVAFQQRLQTEPQTAQVVRSEEYERRAAASGSGAIDAGVLALVAILTVAAAGATGRKQQ
jgi:rhombotail lipoprotein